MTLKENVSAFAVKQILSYMDKDPEKNLPKLLDWFDRFDRKDTLKAQREAIRKAVMDKDNNWRQLVISLWTDIDPGVRNRLFENFILNGCLLGYQRQNEYKEKYNCNIPWAILLDPTSACNLKCTGCWAAESREDGATATLTQMEISSPALSFTILIPISGRRLFWRLTALRCSWAITTTSPGMRTIREG